MTALGLRLLQIGRADGAGHDLRVDVGLAHPPGDQLGVLSSEIDHEHRVVLLVCLGSLRLPGVRHAQPSRQAIPTRCARCSAFPSVCSDGANITSAFWNSLTSA